MHRRAEIRMSEGEQRRFLDQQRVVTVATLGPGGRPHLAPLWYVLRDDGCVAAWTYATSQKIRNLERRPEATIQVEAGDTYDQLRGVTMECDVELVRDPDELVELGWALTVRYAGEPSDEAGREGLQGFVRSQAAKRVGMVFRPTRVTSWDHRKLGGSH